jgi:hypothetical protein
MGIPARPLRDWVVEWAARHDTPVEVVEADAVAHLEALGALDGIEPGEIHTWHVTEGAARRLLDGLEESRRRR